MKTLVTDIEANGLFDYTELWYAATYCLETKEARTFEWRPDRGHIEEFRDYVKDATGYIGHNFISYDRWVLHKLADIHIPVNIIYDTLVRSRLFNSARQGGHALERYGAFFNIPKVGADITDWSYYQPIMGERCKRDVEITLRLYNLQKTEGKNFSKTSIRIEEQFQQEADNIRRRGFPINIPLLEKKYTALLARRGVLEDKIRTAFPPRPVKVAEVIPKLTKSGVYAKNTKGFNALEEKSSLVQGPFTLIEWQVFNMKSHKQITERMEEYGWKPYILTKSGKSFSTCEENLNTLPDDAPPEAQLIPEYKKVSTRIEKCEEWFTHYNEDTGKVHGSIIGIGATTHRCAHNNPQTANIPSNDDQEWKVREVWGFPPTETERVLVGADAKGIQMRVLAHLLAKYTDDQTFMSACLEGDIHTDFTLPILASVFPDAPALQYSTSEELHAVKQNVTKRFIYAYVLGMGNEKAGTLLKLDAKQGKIGREQFTKKFPGMAQLKQDLKRQADIGWAGAPDGRLLPIPSEFRALSVHLQAIEAILLKLAILVFTKERDKRGLDAWIVAFVHDEVQMDCHKDCADEAGELFSDCIRIAGEMLKLRCPMGGSYKKGLTWWETH